MDWNDFYNIVTTEHERVDPGNHNSVIVAESKRWIIRRQPSDKAVFLDDKTTGLCWQAGGQLLYQSAGAITQKATGSILMAGLGVGHEMFILAHDYTVNSITVVESDQEIIDLTTQYLSHSKITIVHDRILHYMENTGGETYDTIYFDIFPASPTQFSNETKILTEAANKVLNPGGRVLFWNLWKPLEL